MFYVYVLQSELVEDQTYVGFTTDLRSRLNKHNEGGSPHTAEFKPWRIAFYSAYYDKEKALDFEKYLKSHSGKAFSRKRLF